LKRLKATRATAPNSLVATGAGVAGDVASTRNAVAALNQLQWHTVERPVWRPAVIWQAPSVAHPVKRPVKRHGGSQGLRERTTLLTALARILVAAVLFLAALDLAGSGLVMNARYASSLGSGESATIQALIGIAIDAIALALLSAGYLLWSHGHRRFAVLAWIVWPAMLGLSLMNTIGFSATNISDALAKRSAAITKASTEANKASTTASDIQDWRNERKAITEKRSVEEIKLELARNRFKVDRIDRDAFAVTVGCTRLTADVTKACNAVASTLQALAAAQRRDGLTKKIGDAEKPQEGKPQEGEDAPTITSVDPQAEMVPKLVAWITRGKIEPTPDDIALVRILGLTVPPLLAGLFLMFATALLAPPRTASQSRG
jgi:hypothetical protein